MNVCDPVLVVVALRDSRTDALRHRVRKAVVSSTTAHRGVPYAMLRPLGLDIPSLLLPENEGITWCRGWSREDRDALWSAWCLAMST